MVLGYGWVSSNSLEWGAAPAVCRPLRLLGREGSWLGSDADAVLGPLSSLKHLQPGPEGLAASASTAPTWPAKGLKSEC